MLATGRKQYIIQMHLYKAYIKPHIFISSVYKSEWLIEYTHIEFKTAKNIYMDKTSKVTLLTSSEICSLYCGACHCFYRHTDVFYCVLSILYWCDILRMYFFTWLGEKVT